MKATRLFLAALTLALVSACGSADITGPSAVDGQVQQSTERGTFGSGSWASHRARERLLSSGRRL